MGEAVTSQIRDELLIMGVQARGFITRLIQTFFFNILFCNCARCEQYYDICHILQYLHFSAKIKFAKLPNCSFKNQTSFVDARVQRDERKMNLSSIGSPGPPRMQLDEDSPHGEREIQYCRNWITYRQMSWSVKARSETTSSSLEEPRISLRSIDYI